MKKINLLISLIVYSITASSQNWSETGDNHTTGQLFVGTTSVDIQATGVEDLVIGNGSSSRGFVVNAGVNNDAIMAFGKNGSMVARFQYNNPSGDLWYYKPGLGNLLTISNGGYLGIGTSQPNRALHIKSDDDPLRLEGTSNAENASTRILMNVGNTSRAMIKWHKSGSSSTDGKISFGTRGSDGLIDRMNIDGNGNVGVGIDPIERLDISDITYLRSAPTHSTITEQLRIGRSDLNVRYHSMYSIHSGNPSNSYLQFRVHNGNDTDPTEQTTVMTLNGQGFVGIGTDSPESKLAVDGQIRATEVKVLADISVPDYVFEPDYELRTLKETKEYITKNKHLPEIPSAAEIGENGIDLGDMNMRLLKKIEELTLYQIELLEKLEQQNEQLQEQQKRIEKLENK